MKVEVPPKDRHSESRKQVHTLFRDKKKKKKKIKVFGNLNDVLCFILMFFL